MKKADLLLVFGTGTKLAEQFSQYNKGKPLSKPAISEWGETIPELRAFQLRELHPDIDERIANAKRARQRKAKRQEARAS